MTQAIRIGWRRSIWTCPLSACHPFARRLMDMLGRGFGGRVRGLSADLETASKANQAGDDFAFVLSRTEGEAAASPDTADKTLVHDAARAMDRHGSSILRLAYSYLHNREDSEDILQEALIRYIRKAPPFENERHERAWLLTVTANLSKNKIRYSRLREWDELNEELLAEERKDLSFVWEAVKSLPVQYREAIHLFYEEGYGSADIAAILGQKDATVRSNLKRAREKLRTILMEEYDFPDGC